MSVIDVVDLVDEPENQIVVRFPASGEADLRWGTNLIVRESQVCIFYRGGQALDTFGPGRHKLATGNLPLLNKLVNLPFGGETPFKAECYFINMKTFINRKWETAEPITFRDEVLKVVRLQASGIQSFKIVDPQLFVNKVVGTAGRYESQGITSLLNNIIVGRLTDVLGENLKTLLDLAALYDEIGIATKARTHDDFGKYGVELEDLVLSAITPPPEVQEKIDERAGLGLFEDAMPALQQQQAAYAMRDIANNPGEAGGVASQGMGMGMGLGMGFMMPGMMAGAMPGMRPPQQPGYPPQQPGYPPQQPGYPPQQQGYPPQQQGYPPQQQAPQQQPAPQATFCGGCGQPVTAGFKFCAQCGSPVGG
ncbi:MAG: SPFH domain-containing protein [bacterium]